MPTDAEDDCITAVSSAPAAIPATGLPKTVRIRVNSGTAASGFTVPLISSMPKISTVKPRKAYPRSRRQEAIDVNAVKGSSGANAVGLRSPKTPPPPSCVSESNHEVKVVPRFAPIITPTD